MDFRHFVKKRIKNVFDGFVLYNGKTRRLKRNNVQKKELPRKYQKNSLCVNLVL
jgi:hypothetical protein